MNPIGPITKESDEQNQAAQAVAAEIPAYPGAVSGDYQPGQEEVVQPLAVHESPIAPQIVNSEVPSLSKEQVNLYNSPEAVAIPQSKTPELQTAIAPETTREGERIFVNPELGQSTFSTFSGGVTSQQLVSKVAGYYTVQQGLISDPKSGLLQQTATTGDPTNGTTWQATVLFKILQAFWNILGIS